MSIADSSKKRGRPITGIGKTIGLRLYPNEQRALDAFIASEPDPKPSRPEAIRRVLTKALGGEQLPDRNPTSARERAAEARSHAAGVADGEMRGMDASSGEKAKRRTSLTDESPMVAKARTKRTKRPSAAS